MTTVLLLVLALIPSCSTAARPRTVTLGDTTIVTTEHCYNTKQGLVIDVIAPVTCPAKVTVEAITEDIIKGSNRADDVLSGGTVLFTQHPLLCRGDHVNSCTEGNFSLVRDQTPLWPSALRHALGHQLYRAMGNTDDIIHIDCWYWTKIDQMGYGCSTDDGVEL